MQQFLMPNYDVMLVYKLNASNDVYNGLQVLKCNPIVTEAGTLDEGLNEALPLLLAPANFHNNE